ncbi:transporter [Ganoderma sinense ZZ0214-1]|uniref:Transporter n=1 Tax=Ganoderma sinense ZZ0214-1 TaxID=1077348 RepID=A0A2G8SNA7_9APHY|nr:transporter [Ganoderma sinense ZZ0214-1]
MPDESSPPIQHPANTSPRASYVYPVRSLLTGIQPAKNRRSSLDDDDRHAASRKNSVETLHRSSSSNNLPSPLNLPAHDPFDDLHDPSDSTVHARATSSSSHRGKCKRSSPNFRDFLPDQSPFSHRTFSTALPPPRPSSSALRADVLFALGPVGDSLAHLSQAYRDSDDLDIYNPRHPPHLSDVVAEAFADVTSRGALIPQAPVDAVDDDGLDRIVPSSVQITAGREDNRNAGMFSSLPADFLSDEPAIPASCELVPFSQTGIVHLGPRDDTTDGQSGSRSSSGGPSPSPRARYSPSSQSRSQGHSQSPRVSLLLPVEERNADSSSLSADAARSSLNPPSLSLASHLESDSSGVSAPGQHMTLRYRHVEDKNGHHLIVGREGKLARCEDEPIRTPGAVQGFGILIAVEEDNETGNLIVRQVSENSTELLGLSPSYLFRLECLSQTFSEQQADVLFDNIQYLSETSVNSEEQAENLHVFMLSGYGEPGSAIPEELSLGRGDPQARRTWSCWCAAHRPQMTAPANLASGENGLDNAYQNIIILEFELERDSFNPLYPPPSTSEDGSLQSGVSSPSNQSVSASASNSSGRTLVSQSSDASTSISTPESSASGRDALFTGSSGTGSLPSALSPALSSVSQAHNVDGDDDWLPSVEDVLESTTSRSKPLPALERLRRTHRPGAIGGMLSPDSVRGTTTTNGSNTAGTSTSGRGGFRRRRGAGAVGMMDVFAVMAQINEQLGAAPDLDTFLKVTVGVMKDLTQFHRVLVYQFDEAWNGQAVAELVDWNQTHDLYRGLHFPAADIPAQARQLYALNKVRLLYDRELPTARLVVRSKEDLDKPLDMTHCYLRAMSPIHLKYLENMGVRASMSVSIIAFGTLWGLVACHSYGPHGMRVSFPVRQMLRLLSQSISRNIERLSYAQRLHTRKLINTMPSDQHPSGYIVSNADDLLGLFDADYGVLVIGEGAKILGPNQHGQEILIVAEYLRLKQFNTLQVSQAVTVDYPDLKLTTGLEVIAGLLYVPLSAGGRDFIAFLRKGQPRQVKWAGRPQKGDDGPRSVLEPRASFKTWAETVAGRCRVWSDDHLETAGVLALVYGKFIEVWRQKESALQTTKLTNLLLSNASHEVRTPLNHIINYLELALNGPLDNETRENLSHSHAASKSLLFTINDLLDLTRLESGNEIAFNEPFDLHQAIDEATHLYRNEAWRRGLKFSIDVQHCPRHVVGDCKKIRTVVANLTANALKYTTQGDITVVARHFDEPTGLRNSGDIAIEIVISDSGCGIPSEKLESIFREFEQVESTPQRAHLPGLGLGLAVVARIVEQLSGQLRVDSTLGSGSRFSFLIPLTTETSSGGRPTMSSPSPNSSQSSLAHSVQSLPSRNSSRGSEIDNLVEAISSSHMDDSPKLISSSGQSRMVDRASPLRAQNERGVEIQGSANPLKPVKVDEFDLDSPIHPPAAKISHRKTRRPGTHRGQSDVAQMPKLRILIVEDNDINRMILAKRLSLDGHTVVNTTNGQEGLEVATNDPNFDCILMDIQMPLLNGYEATKRIRAVEQDRDLVDRASHKLNGRLPIFAVSASLFETQREELFALGMDGWILKPIDFKRLRAILWGVIDPSQREKDVYHPTANWEIGGWLSRPDSKVDL